MNHHHHIISVIVLLILLTLVGVYYSVTQKQMAQLKTQLAGYQLNRKVIEFNQLFLEKVLQARKEVDFDTRLLLEQKVRDLKDEDILSQWNKLLAAKSEKEAQQETVNLLKLLSGKIQRY